MSYRRALLVFCGLVLAIARPGAAAVFDHDDQFVPTNTIDSPYAPIGLVNGGLFGRYTTGFLVDECHVLTTQHLFESRAALGKRLHFKAGITTGHPLASNGTVVASGGYERFPKYSPRMKATIFAQARAADWLLARLDTCIGTQLGYVRIADEIPPSTPLMSAGFPSGRWGRGSMKVDPSCSIRAWSDGLALNDCAALPGNSGSPLFRIVNDHGRTVLEVYAMQSAGMTLPIGYPFALSYSNVATPLAQVAPQLAELDQTTASQMAAIFPR